MDNKHVFFLMFAAFVCLYGFAGCKSAHHTTIRQLREADISQSIICHDTVFWEPDIWIDSTNTYAHEDSLCLQKYGHIEPLGYRGPNFQRFYIHYDNVKHQGNGDYLVNGHTRCRDTVRHFSGFIVLDSIVPYTDSIVLEYAEEVGIIHSHYVFNEDENSVGAGTLTGRATYDYAKLNGRFYYDFFWAVADGYCNNQYEGTWTSYDGKRKEKCNWGDFRIPDSQALDTGCGMFFPDEKFTDFGWKQLLLYLNATWGTAEYDSLEKINEADELWWMQ